jgi:hypothetical protein
MVSRRRGAAAKSRMRVTSPRRARSQLCTGSTIVAASKAGVSAGESVGNGALRRELRAQVGAPRTDVAQGFKIRIGRIPSSLKLVNQFA